MKKKSLILAQETLYSLRGLISIQTKINNNGLKEFEKNKVYIKKFLYKTELKNLMQGILIHRLSRFFYSSILIEDLFPELKNKIKQSCYQEVVKTYELFELTKEISSSLKDLHIKFLVLKGIPLSLQTTKSILGRGSSNDLDIIIEIKDLNRVINLLNRLGFKVNNNSKTYLQNSYLGKYSRFVNNELFLYRKFKDKFQYIDLHWHLAPYYQSIFHFESAYANRMIFKFNNIEIPTINIEQAFKYSCLHSAMDNWMCIRDLIDIERLSKNFSFKKFSIINKEKFTLWSTYAAYKVTKSDYLNRNEYINCTSKYYVKYQSNKQQCLPKRSLGYKGGTRLNKIKYILRQLVLANSIKDKCKIIIASIFPPFIFCDSQKNRIKSPLKILHSRFSRIFINF